MNKLTLVGASFSLLFLASALFAAVEQPQSRKRFVFSPQQLRWFAYDELGNVVRSGRASGGKDFCRDTGSRCRTPEGEFKVISKRGPNCRSSQFPIGRGGAPMPYCMFFHRGYAIHGSNDVPDRHASHGCVRVEKQDAEWLSKEFIDIGTRVIIDPYDAQLSKD